MKKYSLLALVVFLFVAGQVVADCPTPPSGPYYGSFGYTWYVYSQDQGCYTTSGSVSSATVSCSYMPGWQFSGSSSAVASFMVGSTVSNQWEVGSFVEFNGTSLYDQAEIDVAVTHNGSTNGYLIWGWNGTNGSLNGCAEQSGTFTAESGDTVEVQVQATNWSSATIRLSTPRIFNVYHP